MPDQSRVIAASCTPSAERQLALRLGIVVDRVPLTLRSVLIEFHQPPRFLSGNDHLAPRAGQPGEGPLPGRVSTQGQADLKPEAFSAVQAHDRRDEYPASDPPLADQRPRLEAVNDTGLIFSRDDDAGVPYDDLSGQEPGCWRRVLVPWAQIITITCGAAS